MFYGSLKKTTPNLVQCMCEDQGEVVVVVLAFVNISLDMGFVATQLNNLWLAGCSVGKKLTKATFLQVKVLNKLYSGCV